MHLFTFDSILLYVLLASGFLRARRAMSVSDFFLLEGAAIFADGNVWFDGNDRQPPPVGVSEEDYAVDLANFHVTFRQEGSANLRYPLLESVGHFLPFLVVVAAVVSVAASAVCSACIWASSLVVADSCWPCKPVAETQPLASTVKGSPLRL